ncbi:MAG: hypothetical protein GQE15_29625 [Archangiaceae bacterium]|nr:hypothetical protein [Archangiaceae bacterium]
MTYRFRALVEDRDHEQLIRGLLDRRNLTRAVRFEAYPPGRGAAERRVRDQFPAFVRDLRAKRNQRDLWGLVVLDGDVEGMASRRASLVNSVDPVLTEEDRVVLLVPTRNVQTWAWCLLGNPVDEHQDYKSLVKERLRELFANAWEPARESEPPSLVQGRIDWSRL